MITLMLLAIAALIAITILLISVCSGGIIFIIFGADIALGIWIIVSIVKCFRKKKEEGE